jgi:hypothetical protein
MPEMRLSSIALKSPSVIDVIHESLGLLSIYDKEMKVRSFSNTPDGQEMILDGTMLQFRLLNLILKEKIPFMAEVSLRGEWYLIDDLHS